MPGPDRYVLFGHPVSHSWSPFIHGMFAKQSGADIHYSLMDVAPERFRRAVVEFFQSGGSGANVTLPHKQAAAELAHGLTDRAARAGAVNTIAVRWGDKLYGDNTDGAGLVHDLKANLGIRIAGYRVLVLGAGGAVRGVLGPLLAERPVELVIANRTVDRAERLAAEFIDLGAIRGVGFDAVGQEPWDIVINGTSASLAGEVPDLPARAVGPDSVCYDMAYARTDTPFQRWAASRGVRRSHKGWGMLVEQAAESWVVWRGTRPDTGPVLTALASL